MNLIIQKWALKNAVEHGGKTVVGFVINKVIGEKPDARNNMKKLALEVKKVVDEVNKKSADEQKKELLKIWPEALEKRAEEKKELPELPNAEKGKVVLRLAPFPSGALHIGNAKTYMLNALYAEKYGGKLIFVMDDTIGSEEKQIMLEAYDLIPEGFRWLGVKWNGDIIYKSDRLKIYYEHAEKILKMGKAYVCECSAEELREKRGKGIECKCRGQTVEENLKKWKKMLGGGYKEGEATVRIKTNMKDPNPAFRDRVLLRISDREHPRTGKKCKVWPLLEFSWAIDDHLLGITHVIRGKDLMMESEMCKYLWKILGWKPPTILHAGLVQIEGAKISKSKAQKEVAEGTYAGWDDPRTWSIQSLRRRGILPGAIRQFIFEIGLNQNDITVPIDKLYAINRNLIDKTSDRYFFVPNPQKFVIGEIPKTSIDICLYPGEPDKGTKKYLLEGTKTFFLPKDDLAKMKKGDVFRLKDAFAIELVNKSSGKYVATGDLNMPKLQWVTEDSLDVEVLMDDGTTLKGAGEGYLKNVKEDQHLQFERFGYVRVNKKSPKKVECRFTHK